MTARTIAGWPAIASGAALAVAMLASAIAGWSGLANASGAAWMTGPGMMLGGQMGSGMMGMGAMDHGMMGFGQAGPAATAIPGATEVRVQAANFSFSPSELRLPRNADVNLTFSNPTGTGVVHDLTVPALGIHIAANPGETQTVGLRGLATGRYDAYCSVPGHADLGMRATVIVE